MIISEVTCRGSCVAKCKIYVNNEIVQTRTTLEQPACRPASPTVYLWWICILCIWTGCLEQPSDVCNRLLNLHPISKRTHLDVNYNNLLMLWCTRQTVGDYICCTSFIVVVLLTSFIIASFSVVHWDQPESVVGSPRSLSTTTSAVVQRDAVCL